MCVQVTTTANRFEISSLLEKVLLKQVKWYLTFVGLYNYISSYHIKYESTTLRNIGGGTINLS
jgi:hypothetical protein